MSIRKQGYLNPYASIRIQHPCQVGQPLKPAEPDKLEGQYQWVIDERSDLYGYCVLVTKVFRRSLCVEVDIAGVRQIVHRYQLSDIMKVRR